MTDFNPGEGWREVPEFAIDWGGDAMTATIDGVQRYWVREVPVPPLPTEPYTVIRVQPDIYGVAVLSANGIWYNMVTGNILHVERITGFEVLARPKWEASDARDAWVRRETAKAVLGRVAEEHALRSEQLDRIADEFGVSS